MTSDFELHYVVTASREHFRDSSTSYEYRIIHLPSDEVVMSFPGEDFRDARGAGSVGTVSCLLIEQHGMVMTRNTGGEISHHNLPESIH